MSCRFPTSCRSLITALAALTATVVLTIGCTAPGAGAGSGAPAKPSSAADSPGNPANTGDDDYSDLLAQSQRAVAEVKAMRQRSAEATPPAANGAEPVTGTTAAAPAAPQIQWNAPDDLPGPGSTPTRANPSTPIDANPAPLAVAAAHGVDPVTGRPLATDTPALRVDPMDLQLVELRRELYQLSVDSDQPIRELIAIAAMGIIDPELQQPQSARSDLTERERELLAKMHAFFVDLGRSLDDEAAAGPAIVGAVQSLEAALVEAPTLDLPAALLCWRVGGFGDYDVFEPTRFLAHAEQKVILYLEIDGFTSELNRDQDWVTELSQQLEIYSTQAGVPVWGETWQKAVDVSTKQRRDFFTTQLITIPKALSVGQYQLKVRVRDEKSGALSELSLPFEMVADPKLAASIGG